MRFVFFAMLYAWFFLFRSVIRPPLLTIIKFCFVCFHLMVYALCRRPPTIAHYFKIWDSCVFYKQIRGSWCPDLSFGMLGGSTLAPWWNPGTILGHSGAQQRTSLLPRPVISHAWWLNFGVLVHIWTILGHNKEFVEVPARISFNFWWI